MTPWFTLALVAVVLGSGLMLGGADDTGVDPGTATPAMAARPDSAGPVAVSAGDDGVPRDLPLHSAEPAFAPDARREALQTAGTTSTGSDTGVAPPELGHPAAGVTTATGNASPAAPAPGNAGESPSSAGPRDSAPEATAPTEPGPPAPSTEVASIDSTPMVAPGRSSTTGRVIQLMLAANAAMDELRLTLPKDDNALRHYREVLALSPGHPGARAGITAIAERYADMAENAMQRGAINTAASYVRRGLGVQPKHGRLLELQRAVAKARRTQQAPTPEPREEKRPEPVENAPPEDDTIVGKPGTGDIVGDFKRVWRAVFD